LKNNLISNKIKNYLKENTQGIYCKFYGKKRMFSFNKPIFTYDEINRKNQELNSFHTIFLTPWNYEFNKNRILICTFIKNKLSDITQKDIYSSLNIKKEDFPIIIKNLENLRKHFFKSLIYSDYCLEIFVSENIDEIFVIKIFPLPIIFRNNDEQTTDSFQENDIKIKIIARNSPKILFNSSSNSLDTSNLLLNENS
jgi:hypothetical protein